MRWAFLRRAVLTLLIVLLGVLLVTPVILGFSMAYSLTNNTCVSPQPTLEGYNLIGEEVTFPSGELTLTAYFIPGDTDGTVIVAPAWNHDHNGQLDYAAMLNEVGLNVLVMGSRLCVGEPSTLGYREGDDVSAAYAYLITRDEVDPTRVSAHGFSAGGAAALFSAARTPEIRAVSAMGNYHDFERSMGVGSGDLSLVAQLTVFGVRWGYRAGTGLPVSVLKATDAVEQINPRPMLFVYGTLEPTIDGHELLARAENGTLWEVEGVGHGGYIQAYPEEAREIIGGFHLDVLLDDATP